MPKKIPLSPGSPRTDLTQTLELVPIADLRAHPRNYLTHPPDQIAHIKASIAEHAIYRNIVIAQDGTILAGHGVVQAAQELGHTHVPVQRMPYAPDDPRALKLVVGDNEIARRRLSDDAQLAALLQEAAALDPQGLLGTGFDETMLAALREQVGESTGSGHPSPPEVEEPEEPWDRVAEVVERWKVQPGDLWACGEHRIICADCLAPATLERLLDGQTPQMVFADPPYGVSIVATTVPVGGGEAYDIPCGGVKQPRRRGYVGEGQRQKDRSGYYPIETWEKELRGTVGAAKPFGSKAQRGSDGASHVVAVGKYAPIIGDDSTESAIRAATMLLNLYPEALHIWWGGNYYANALPASSCWLVWDKETTGHFADCELAWTNQDKAARLFRHQWNGMLRDSEHERRWHPTQKPAALAAWVYERLGKVGDLILDPFLGSAPSLLAASQMGRIVYGCELSVEYMAIALERWVTLTSQTPVRLS